MAFPSTWLCVCACELILFKGERIPTKINEATGSDGIREARVTRDFTWQSESAADLRVILLEAEIRSHMQA
jgi:hypothetical protein